MKQILFLFLVVPLFTFAQWVQVGTDIDGEAIGDQSGNAISLSADGNILAVGAYLNDGNTGTNSGHVRVYEWTGSAWAQMGDDIDGSYQSSSGKSVSLSSDGSILAIGAYLGATTEGTSGFVRVYEWTGSVWAQKGSTINGEAAVDYWGDSVSLSSDGSILAIGASGNDGNGTDSGHVQVYEWTGSAWVQKGDEINGESAGDRFGITVSLSSNGIILAIGAFTNDGANGDDSGHVRVFEWTGSTWAQKGVDIDGEAIGDNSGVSVSLSSDGSILAVGAYSNDGNGTDSGHARVFEWLGSSWNQMGIDIDGEFAGDRSGRSVSLNNAGNILAVGAYLNYGSTTGSGHVRVFEWTGSMWNQIGNDIDGESSNNYSGISTSLSNDGSTIAIGAHYNNENGIQSGHVRVFSNASLSVTTSTFGLQFKVQPNPSFGSTNIELGDFYKEVQVSVFDLLGKEVMSETYTNINKTELDTQQLTTGVYIVKVESYTNKASLKLIVK